MFKRRFLVPEFMRGILRFQVSPASRSRKLLLAALSAVAILAGAASLAPSASASQATGPTVTLSGGMVRAGSAAAQEVTPAANPSCHSIKYVGSAGFISVQESGGRLQWGITMTPLTYSIGTWSVSTYLSGKKTTSGFNKTVPPPGYIPHGSLSVPSGKVFTVSAEVTGPNGTFVNVPNACTT